MLCLSHAYNSSNYLSCSKKKSLICFSQSIMHCSIVYTVTLRNAMLCVFQSRYAVYVMLPFSLEEVSQNNR